MMVKVAGMRARCFKWRVILLLVIILGDRFRSTRRARTFPLGLSFALGGVPPLSPVSEYGAGPGHFPRAGETLCGSRMAADQFYRGVVGVSSSDSYDVGVASDELCEGAVSELLDAEVGA